MTTDREPARLAAYYANQARAELAAKAALKCSCCHLLPKFCANTTDTANRAKETSK